MSYSGVHNYPPYYGQDRAAQNVYPRTEQQATSAPLHPGTDAYAIGGRQSEYGSNAYNWVTQQQTQHGYGPVNGEMSQQASSSWREINDHHQSAGDHQNSAPNHESDASHAATTMPYYNGASQPAASHSTHALSNLAYASGLESVGLQNASNQGGQSTKSGQNTHRQSQNSGYGPSSGSSPAQSLTQSYQSQHSTQSYMSHRSQSQSELAMSAAAALAGAVSRKHAGQRSPATSSQQPQVSKMGNSASKQTAAAQAVNGFASPYSAVGQVSNKRAQHHRMQPAPTLSSPNIPPPASTTKQASNVRQSSQATQSPPSASNSSAQNDSSIANLVTNTSPQQAAAMPSFVDPTQVFNPYHKEYERQKREAAEAEARKHVSKQPSSQTEQGATWGRVIIPGESTAATTEASTAKTSQGTKRKRQSDASHASNSAPPKQVSDQQSPTEEDVEMATEMKAMIEKMRSWKNKDPLMFQKLWEEMKKGGPGQPAPGSTGSTSTPSPQIRRASLPKAREPRAPSKEAAEAPVTATAASTPPPGVPMHLNGYTIVVENNPEELPDLGRFPAERRYRGRYKRQLSTQAASIPVDPNLIAFGKSINSNPKTAPVPTAQPEHQAQAGSQPPRPSGKQSSSQQASQPPPSQAVKKPPTQGQTGMLAKGSTLWPEEKRKSLAEAAVKALNANPANIDKNITAQGIHDLLEQNPSYVDLCTMLENRGLVLQRGQFARSLLSNVPDLANPQQRTEPGPKKLGTNSPASFEKPAVGPPPAKWQPFMNGGAIKPEGDIGQQSARFSGPARADGNTQPKFGNARLHVPSPQAPSPKPGSKEAMARKRDFAELVDLSQLSDDEDYVMPSKKPRTEEAELKREVFQIDDEVSLPHLTAPSNRSTMPGPGQAFVASSAQPLQFNSNQSQPLIAPAPPAKPKTTLARKINKNEALRKSYYDPKTVARDILIAAGRHLTERPLNAHMAGLLNKHIDIDSDLATFDWDAVDPGGSPMPRVQMVDIPAGPPRWKLGVRRKLGEDDQPSEPIRIAPYLPAKRGPASQTALNSVSRLSAQTTSLTQKSQRPINGQTQPQSRLRQYEVADEAAQNAMNTGETPPNRNSTPAQASTRVASSHTRTTTSPTQQRAKSAEGEKNMDDGGSFWPSGKRRGRPPGAKNKHPSITTMKNAAYTGSHVSMPATTGPIHYENYDCHWRKCGVKLHNLPTLRKHISKLHQERPEKVSKNGHVCWWKKCSTLTRNEDKTVTPNTYFPTFETWMKHIEEAHLHPLGMEKGDGPSTLHIGKPKSLNLTQYIYEPRQDLARTVSYVDPQQIAADRAKYLADEQGRQVTFPATDNTNEEYAADALVILPPSGKPKYQEQHDARVEFMRTHGNEKLDVKKSAEETLRAMETRKERIGPGMDRGGCTLVNQERRATLIQDQGLTRIIGD